MPLQPTTTTTAKLDNSSSQLASAWIFFYFFLLHRCHYSPCLFLRYSQYIRCTCVYWGQTWEMSQTACENQDGSGFETTTEGLDKANVLADTHMQNLNQVVGNDVLHKSVNNKQITTASKHVRLFWDGFPSVRFDSHCAPLLMASIGQIVVARVRKGLSSVFSSAWSMSTLDTPPSSDLPRRKQPGDALATYPLRTCSNSEGTPFTRHTCGRPPHLDMMP